jgi:hypothetical protein
MSHHNKNSSGFTTTNRPGSLKIIQHVRPLGRSGWYNYYGCASIEDMAEQFPGLTFQGPGSASGNPSANSYTADGSERSLVNECRAARGDLSADWAQPGDRRGRTGRDRRALIRNARLLQFTAAGVDWVPTRDLPRELPVAANKGGGAEPMSEHIVALALAAAKRLFIEHAKLKRGEFNRVSAAGMEDGPGAN